MCVEGVDVRLQLLKETTTEGEVEVEEDHEDYELGDICEDFADEENVGE